MIKKACMKKLLRRFVNILVVGVIAIVIYQLEQSLRNMARRVRFQGLNDADQARMNLVDHPLPDQAMRRQVNIVRRQRSTSFLWSQFELANRMSGRPNAELITIPNRFMDFSIANKRTIGNYAEYVFLKHSAHRHVFVEGTAVDGEIEDRRLNPARTKKWTKYGKKHTNSTALEMKAAKQEFGVVTQNDARYVDKRYKISRENIVGLYSLSGMDGRIYACNVFSDNEATQFQYRYMTFAEAIAMQLGLRNANNRLVFSYRKQLFFIIARIMNSEGGLNHMINAGAIFVDNRRVNNLYDDGQVVTDDEEDFYEDVI